MPIPSSVIKEVVAALLRFRMTCDDFGVPSQRIRIVATEATRTALNSEEFQQIVRDAIDINVEMLSKEDEGRLGALGIASSFHRTEGLVMDLGGGSIQLSWVDSTENNEIKICDNGSVSLPYGAAALTKRLEKATNQAEKDELHGELLSEITQACERIGVIDNLGAQSRRKGHLHVYLSGGGFRGWGYILMSRHAIQPYPVPIINGFSVDGKEFTPSNVSHLQEVDNSIFRISSRRASQVPAVSLLITALTTILSTWLEKCRIYFSQGGVREGLLFSILSSSVQASSPLVAATSPYAPPSAAALISLLRSALPPDGVTAPKENSQDSASLLIGAVNLAYSHAPCPKDIRASSALRSSTTGILAEIHGLSHEERAYIGLILFERWHGDLPPTDVQFHSGLQQLIGPESSFWAAYVGSILNGLGDIFPAGKVREDTLAIDTKWTIREGGSKHGEPLLHLSFAGAESQMSTIQQWAVNLEKLGKKKHWVRSADGKNPGGFKIECTVRTR